MADYALEHDQYTIASFTAHLEKVKQFYESQDPVGQQLPNFTIPDSMPVEAKKIDFFSQHLHASSTY